jgi:hypothetical protein
MLPILCLVIYVWLVWTRCLLHRCVCIWRYILWNYNYKLHFQNLFIYHIPHVSIGTLAAENLDVCTACDPGDSNIQLTMVNDRRPGPGMPFPHSNTCTKGGVGIYFCQGFLPCMMPSMDGWRDGWMEKASLPRRPLLYVIRFMMTFASCFTMHKPACMRHLQNAKLVRGVWKQFPEAKVSF